MTDHHHGRPHLDGRETCDGCFLECERTTAAFRDGYPCSRELREWAAAHRNDPAGLVTEGRDDG